MDFRSDEGCTQDFTPRKTGEIAGSAKGPFVEPGAAPGPADGEAAIVEPGATKGWPGRRALGSIVRGNAAPGRPGRYFRGALRSPALQWRNSRCAAAAFARGRRCLSAVSSADGATRWGPTV